MKTEKAIDYLQFSIDKYPFAETEFPHIAKSNLPFYNKCKQYSDGTRIYLGNPNSDKELVVWSGRVCKAKIATMKDSLKTIIDNGGKVSRVDFAVTVDNHEYLSDFAKAIKRGNLVSRRYGNDEHKIISDTSDEIQTVYVGDMSKRGKKGIFRAYDKGKELGLDIDLTRFELECRRDVAHNNAVRYSQGVEIGNIIRSAVDLPNEDWWVDTMGNNEPLPQLDIPKEKENGTMESRWVWLVNTVAPSLAEAIYHDEMNGTENAELFWDVVYSKLNALKVTSE